MSYYYLAFHYFSFLNIIYIFLISGYFFYFLFIYPLFISAIFWYIFIIITLIWWHILYFIRLCHADYILYFLFIIFHIHIVIIRHYLYRHYICFFHFYFSFISPPSCLPPSASICLPFHWDITLPLRIPPIIFNDSFLLPITSYRSPPLCLLLYYFSSD